MRQPFRVVVRDIFHSHFPATHNVNQSIAHAAGPVCVVQRARLSWVNVIADWCTRNRRADKGVRCDANDARPVNAKTCPSILRQMSAGKFRSQWHTITIALGGSSAWGTVHILQGTTIAANKILSALKSQNAFPAWPRCMVSHATHATAKRLLRHTRAILGIALGTHASRTPIAGAAGVSTGRIDADLETTHTLMPNVINKKRTI